jgi:predicted phage terminase large subunit-like protein
LQKKQPELAEILKNPSEILTEVRVRKAREDFWEYRRLLNPDMIVGWWQKEIANNLQQFYQDFLDGKRPILAIESPPQHGKSMQVIDFMAWCAGKNQNLRKMFASYSERLGVRANLKLQRIFSDPLYGRVFPKLKIPTAKDNNYTCNRELIEYIESEGYFRNTTIEGAATGESLDLGFIDDAVKDRKSAGSATVRESTWEWLTNVFMTRFSKDAGLLIVMTRWNEDDLLGRLIEVEPKMKVVKYPAIAINDEKCRKKGEALFPEHKPLDFLLKRKEILGTMHFEALYQQNPVPEGGAVFRKEWIRYIESPRKYKRVVQSWDTAYKPGQQNDPSVCGVWGVHDEGYDLLHVHRQRMVYTDLKAAAIRLADDWSKRIDYYQSHQIFTILIEDKASGQALIPELKKITAYNIEAIKPNADKLTRARVVTPQFESGKVFLLKDTRWLQTYLDELLAFDSCPHDDQVDMTSQFLSYISTESMVKIPDNFVNYSSKTISGNGYFN